MNTNNKVLKSVVLQFFPEEEHFLLQSYGTGHIHLTYLLQLQNKDAYILQRINTKVFKMPVSLCQNTHLIHAYLKKTDYPFALADLICAPNGDFVVEDSNQEYWRVFRYLSNTTSFDQASDPEQAFAASRAFGLFAQKIGNLSPKLISPSIPNFHNCLSRQDQLTEAIRQAPSKRVSEIRKEIDFLDQHLFCRDWRNLQFPTKLSHNDTKINNILFAKDGKTPHAIIDLDTVMPASPLYDFADMVRTYTSAAAEDAPDNEVSLRLDYFAALATGFLEGSKDLLSAGEKSALLLGAYLMVQVQAQRFLADYLNGNVYYQVAYPTHNLIRGRNQLALLKSMLAQEEDMVKVLKKLGC